MNYAQQNVTSLAPGGMGMGGVPTYSGVTTSVPTPISPVHEARQSLASATNELHRTIENLEIRLDGICRPIPPTGNAQGSGGTPTQDLPSEHRAFIVSEAFNVREANARIERLLARIEL